MFAFTMAKSLRTATFASGVSYTLKCQTRSDFGKVTMEFELEVCQLGKPEVVGIRRQRLKGGTDCVERLHTDGARQPHTTPGQPEDDPSQVARLFPHKVIPSLLRQFLHCDSTAKAM
ncbi:hypothetical protein AV530_012161 [Patagioenas fasciata monilis]|uniref:non-specific serine/threonine protein kinase n=1 Tax=Patagioenas fasciata monilis TaxID=372326 RepID=A0A1V4K3H2_PATFA|nr:hypothetical protein AV530_012161 [Patagioenas fasciata monilis]